MLSLDPFSQWLGIEILECEVGRCKVGMTVRPEMLNSMGKAHGGITYSLADTAFGFSANTNGRTRCLSTLRSTTLEASKWAITLPLKPRSKASK
jgi:uncharacterized protein (TIGR00369 family)